ncbi:AAA family ATPase [Vibrio mediterranei]|uniref:AAA family ATPase n=1 Tax=Vibrio mediterranei TaxID=689 RepID=UPI001EFD49A7|nr:AAA family ATPase [Vibrio mediterranei]MCG9624208.1 AAA family ATPase [Vibrio mediterranei]
MVKQDKVIAITHKCSSCHMTSNPYFDGLPKNYKYSYKCGYCDSEQFVEEKLNIQTTHFHFWHFQQIESNRKSFPQLCAVKADNEDNQEKPSIYLEGVSTSNEPLIGEHNIVLSHTKRTDLILTGKNGSGKSTLLKKIKQYLSHLDQVTLSKDRTCSPELYPTIFQNIISTLKHGMGQPHVNYNVDINFGSMTTLIEENVVFSYFDAKRLMPSSSVSNIGKPEASLVDIDNNAASQFLQYLVNRKSQQSMAYTDGDHEEAEEIKQWFIGLEDFFSKIFSTRVKLKFNREKFEYTLLDDNNNSINLNGLSDGYSAILQIVSDIIIRMEANKFGDFNQYGVVLIDEIETHLHVSLQKQVFPLLKSFFPNIQFIITTHSPFVLSSVEDAVIYDMEHKTTITTDESVWQYSYDALVDGYFEVDKFSDVLKEKIRRFKVLNSEDSLDRTDKKELRQLKKELENVPTFKNAAIETELKQLGLK